MVSRMVIGIERIPGTFYGTCFLHPLLFLLQQASFFGTTSRLPDESSTREIPSCGCESKLPEFY
jgi:hypothetical protein